MVECRWANPKRGTVHYARVPLGAKYALASGLMEISYDSGARVILQGPCTYQVNSPAGGYLWQGRLTARVVERGEWRERGEGRARDNQPAVSNPQSARINIRSPLSLSPSPLSPLPSSPSALPMRELPTWGPSLASRSMRRA